MEMRLTDLLQFVLSGVTVGAVYALVALGFTIIYNASDVVNFAQGEFVMIGGMTTFFLLQAGMPPPAAAGLAVHGRSACCRQARDRAGARASSSP
jgi:branched-chain amino acid transport system permease protein